MKLTVAICTWNREKLLDQTLIEMQKLKIPLDIEWELLIVNNNCTDKTDEVIARHTGRMPVRRVFESNPGLSHARNAAVQQASGDYIIWTDDDVLVDEHWLEAYSRAFRACPDLVIFGGPIAPWFENTPPKWLESVWPRVANAYAVRDLGIHPIPLDEEHLPFGANFAIKLSIQRQFNYDPLLGRKGKGMLGSEETNLIKAMMNGGFQGLWVPDAKVRHFIPYSRQNTSYLRRYFHGQGVVLARQNESSSPVMLFGYPRWLVRGVIQTELIYRFRRLFSPPKIWIEDLILASMHWGLLQGNSSFSRDQ
jgi:glucosyl-dolichyl phosphate glucuronosyltransferase